MSAEEHRWNPDRDEDEDEGELQEQLLEIDAFERQ